MSMAIPSLAPTLRLADADLVVAYRQSDQVQVKATGSVVRQSLAYKLATPLPRMAQTFDLTAIDAQLVRVQGGFTDNTNVYIVGHANAVLAKVPIANPAAATALRLGTLSAGFGFPLGGFTDGRYGYLIPHQETAYQCARVDLANFTTGGVTFLDLNGADPTLQSGAINGVFDGRYGYAIMVRHYSAPLPGDTGVVVRFDTTNFTTGGLTNLEIPLPGAPTINSFISWVCDNAYIYILTAHYTDPAGSAQIMITRISCATFAVVDQTAIGSVPFIQTFGMFLDGRYLYTSPASGLAMFRIDTLNWPRAEGIDFGAIDVTLTNGVNIGAVAVGRYGYFLSRVYTKILRVDLQNFGAYDVTDMALADPAAATAGYATVTPAGGFLWITTQAPNVGKMLRYQTDNVG